MAVELEPPVYTVRAVGPFDLGRIARLHRACFDEPWSRADLAHLLALPAAFGLLARVTERGFAGIEARRGVGFALARVVRDEAELLSIGVAPLYRRRGVAGLLLAQSMRRARQAGAARMFLEVAVDNGGAQKLYAGFGFRKVGRREAYYRRPDGARVAALTMQAQLEPPAQG